LDRALRPPPLLGVRYRRTHLSGPIFDPALLQARMPFSLSAWVTPDDRQDFACNVARAVRGRHEDEGGRDLFGLRSALHCGRAAELRELLGLSVRGVERGPHRPRGNRVDANAAVDEVRRKRAGKCVNAALRHGVVEETFVALD